MKALLGKPAVAPSSAIANRTAPFANCHDVRPFNAMHQRSLAFISGYIFSGR